METNTAEEKKWRVYLKPLNPRLTPEDRLDADLRLSVTCTPRLGVQNAAKSSDLRPLTPDRYLPAP